MSASASTNRSSRSRKKIKALKLGETGQFYALVAREGKDLGKLVIHRRNEGQNILGAKDDGGREFVKEILARKQGSLRYHLDDEEWIASFDYIKSWDMVVVGESRAKSRRRL